jgi:hypothetical protein
MRRFINCGICCCIFNVIPCNDHRLVIFNVIPRNDHRLVCGFGLCHADRILLGLLRASSNFPSSSFGPLSTSYIS